MSDRRPLETVLVRSGWAQPQTGFESIILSPPVSDELFRLSLPAENFSQVGVSGDVSVLDSPVRAFDGVTRRGVTETVGKSGTLRWGGRTQRSLWMVSFRVSGRREGCNTSSKARACLTSSSFQKPTLQRYWAVLHTTSMSCSSVRPERYWDACSRNDSLTLVASTPFASVAAGSGGASSAESCRVARNLASEKVRSL